MFIQPCVSNPNQLLFTNSSFRSSCCSKRPRSLSTFHHKHEQVSPLHVNSSPIRARSAATTTVECSSLSDMTDAADCRNQTLINESLGPILRLTLIDKDTQSKLASISGAFLPPDNRLHIESYRSLEQQQTKDENLSLLTVSPSMFIFISALALAVDKKSKHVYGLAINDHPQQHKRLVKYLRRFGGSKLRIVDDSLRSLPDRIAYGGFGAIIKGDVTTMYERGYSMVLRQYAG